MSPKGRVRGYEKKVCIMYSSHPQAAGSFYDGGSYPTSNYERFSVENVATFLPVREDSSLIAIQLCSNLLVITLIV